MTEYRGCLLVANRRGERVYCEHYRSHRERAKAERTVCLLLEMPGYRWVRGLTEQECVERMQQQVNGGRQDAGTNG